MHVPPTSPNQEPFRVFTIEVQVGDRIDIYQAQIEGFAGLTQDRAEAIHKFTFASLAVFGQELSTSSIANSVIFESLAADGIHFAALQPVHGNPQQTTLTEFEPRTYATLQGVPDKVRHLTHDDQLATTLNQSYQTISKNVHDYATKQFSEANPDPIWKALIGYTPSAGTRRQQQKPPPITQKPSPPQPISLVSTTSSQQENIALLDLEFNRLIVAVQARLSRKIQAKQDDEQSQQLLLSLRQLATQYEKVLSTPQETSQYQALTHKYQALLLAIHPLSGETTLFEFPQDLRIFSILIQRYAPPGKATDIQSAFDQYLAANRLSSTDQRRASAINATEGALTNLLDGITELEQALLIGNIFRSEKNGGLSKESFQSYLNDKMLLAEHLSSLGVFFNPYSPLETPECALSMGHLMDFIGFIVEHRPKEEVKEFVSIAHSVEAFLKAIETPQTRDNLQKLLQNLNTRITQTFKDKDTQTFYIDNLKNISKVIIEEQAPSSSSPRTETMTTTATTTIQPPSNILKPSSQLPGPKIILKKKER